MSCLTKKSLFFLVLFNVCNSTLSDETKECIANVRRVFHRSLPPRFNFKIAMILMSQSVVESIRSPEELIIHIKNHLKGFFKYVNADTTPFSRSERGNMHFYIDFFKKWFKNDSDSDDSTPEESNITSEESDNTLEDSEQPYIIGYFHYLVSKLNKIAGYINEIAISPKQFCEEYDVDNEDSLCRNALYAMLSLREFKSKTEIDEMNGYNAFLYCYKYYTYADFTLATFFPETISSNDNQNELSEPSSSEIYLDESFQQLQIEEFSEPSSSGMHQDESNEKLQIGLMVEYYDQMYYVSTQIAVLDEKEDLYLFPTLQEYCTEAFVKTKE